MTDKTDSKEREAIIRAAVAAMPHTNPLVADDLLGGFTMHTEADDIVAIYLAGRASLAASAGSEPVALDHIACIEDGELRYMTGRKAPSYDCELYAMPGGKSAPPLYTHPSPPEGMVGGWIAIPGAMPEPDTPVLLDIGKKYPIRAMWAAKHTVEAADDDTDWAEYDEATDTHYCPEGWYEWNEHEETHWRVTETPRAWAPLPPTSSADSGKGE